MRIAGIIAACALVLSTLACADAPAISSGEAKAILEELKQIRVLLERMQVPAPQPAAPAAPEAPVTLKLDGAFVLGKLDAPVTMVEFSDYECPFCRQFHMASFEEIKRKYIDTGKVRYVSRDFPLQSLHPHALAAAKLARCAGEQGRFWEMRKALIVNGNALNDDTMANLGRSLKLDEKALQACVSDTKRAAALDADIARAGTLGVSGTPTFIVGASKGDSVEGMRIVGAQPLAVFEGRIQSLLDAR